jgi:hypothetical protein
MWRPCLLFLFFQRICEFSPVLDMNFGDLRAYRGAQTPSFVAKRHEMSRPQPVRLALFLTAVLIVLAAVTLAKDAIYIGKHEGDALHLLDMVSRMVAGERIHTDFSTPIGVLALAPIAWFASWGDGYGHAILHAQVLVALVLLPAVWYTIWSRLSGFPAYLTGFYLMVLPLALIHGQSETSVSVSMHYNRWAWAMAYVALLLAILPSRMPRTAILDGVLIGLMLASMALTKVTYFVAFVIPVALSLATLPAFATLLATLLTGAAVAMGMTLWGGIAFWSGYIADLRTVAGSDIRSSPGLPFELVLGAPAYLGVSLALLLGVVVLRQAHQKRVGLVMLVLGVGFAFTTYQNYGNDPQWLILFGILMLALRPPEDMRNGWGWQLRPVFTGLAVVALTFAASSFLNLVYSPFRHLGTNADDYAAILTHNDRNSDILLPRARAYAVDILAALDGPGLPLTPRPEAGKRDTIATLQGKELPFCEVMFGIVAWYAAIAADLEAAGYAGKGIYEVDLLAALPLYGDFRPLRGGSPWYYGGTPGIGDADLVLIADCPLSGESRKLKLEALTEAGVQLTEVRRTPLYRLFSFTLPQATASLR